MLHQCVIAFVCGRSKHCFQGVCSTAYVAARHVSLCPSVTLSQRDALELDVVRFRPPTAPCAWLPRAPTHPSRADPHEVAPGVRPSNAPISGDPGVPGHARRPGLVVGRAVRPNPREEGPTPPDSSLFLRVLGVWLRAGTRCCPVEAVAVALNALGLGRKHSSCLGRCPILGVKATSSPLGHVLVSKLGRRPSALSRCLDAT